MTKKSNTVNYRDRSTIRYVEDIGTKTILLEVV